MRTKKFEQDAYKEYQDEMKAQTRAQTIQIQNVMGKVKDLNEH